MGKPRCIVSRRRKFVRRRPDALRKLDASRLIHRPSLLPTWHVVRYRMDANIEDSFFGASSDDDASPASNMDEHRALSTGPPTSLVDSGDEREAPTSSKRPLLIQDSDDERSARVRSATPPPQNAKSAPPRRSVSVSAMPPPAKKRRIDTEANMSFDPRYLGEFCVENAYSLVSGSGYMSAGDQIVIDRSEQPATHSTSKAKPSGKPGNKGKGKQTKLNFGAMPKQTASSKKLERSTIIRFKNKRGSGEGLLSVVLYSRLSYRDRAFAGQGIFVGGRTA